MTPARLLVDVAIVVWVVAWVAVGVAVAGEVRDLARLGDTVVELGQATQQAGQALGALGSVPFAGERIEEPAAAIREAGTDAIRSGRESRQSAERLAILLGVTIAVIPGAGALALRLQRRRPR